MLTAARTAAAVYGVLCFAALARARAESEHDPWPVDCPKCRKEAPSPFGPVIRTWMNEHECEAAA